MKSKEGDCSILETKVLTTLNSLHQGAKVGDFGCGDGQLARVAQQSKLCPGIVFCGFDNDPEAVRRYNSHLRSTVHKAWEADLTKLAIGSTKFSAGVLLRVLEGMAEWQHLIVLQSIANTLRVGNILCVASLSEKDWRKEALEEIGQYHPRKMNDCYPVTEGFLSQPEVSGPFYFFQPGRLARLGERAGFKVLEQQVIEEPSECGVYWTSYDYVKLQKIRR